MNINEFLQGGKEEMIETILTGTHIASKNIAEGTMLLIAVEGFYVELLHDEKRGEVELYNAFEEEEYLDSYLEEIDISEIIKMLQTGYEKPILKSLPQSILNIAEKVSACIKSIF
jgi:hypothetical protein